MAFWNKNEQAAVEEVVPAEKCPWCGKDMELGYLTSGRGGYAVEWGTKKPGFVFGTMFGGGTILVTKERNMSRYYKTCWYCSNCGKMTISLRTPEVSAQPKEEAGEHDL